jgi:hypothetical protein
MGEGYGPRINDVLRSYMHARLAGVIRGAETVAHFRHRAEVHEGPKPAFGDFDREMGEAWEDEGPAVVSEARVKMQEVLQRRYGAEGLPVGEGVVPLVR